MYRLYIDETGNADLAASRDPNHRYLSLTGIIMSVEHVRHVVRPQLEGIKQDIFQHDPDETIVLHRKDLVNRNYPFQRLRDPAVEADFNQRVLGLMRGAAFVAITTVVDKLEHLNRYVVWQHDPYHYCLEIMIERYVLWLKDRRARGDVMAECRSGTQDQRLRECFTHYYTHGTRYRSAADIQARLTSRQLKLKPKTANTAGLQIADLIAHPSARYARTTYAGLQVTPDFGSQIVDILVASKYNRNGAGKIDGWGLKWLPKMAAGA